MYILLLVYKVFSLPTNKHKKSDKLTTLKSFLKIVYINCLYFNPSYNTHNIPIANVHLSYQIRDDNSTEQHLWRK